MLIKGGHQSVLGTPFDESRSRLYLLLG
jgi:hypothetical protein